MADRELLYISPVIPALTGNGLAMRAGMVLEALAEAYSVSLHVAQLYGGVEVLPDYLRRLCKRVEIAHPHGSHGLLRLLFAPRRRFHTVHVFRLAALPYARPYLRGDCRLHLDLDDIESETRRRLAALRRSNGDEIGAAMEEALARNAEAGERDAMAQVDRLYVCSELDKARLTARSNAPIAVLPNAVRIPSPMPDAPPGPFRFLLIGTLGYYPNEDAAVYFCREVLPRMRDQCEQPFECDIVGTGATERLQETAGAAGAKVCGAVPEVEPVYRASHAVVAPVRAGGGTRIKILEAFSYRRPVVSTAVGAEGIDARDGEEILIGDTPEQFADHCLRLMRDRDLGRRLSENAFDLVQRRYSAASLKRIVQALST